MEFFTEIFNKIKFYKSQNKLYERVLVKLRLDTFWIKKNFYTQVEKDEKIRIAFLIQNPSLWKTYDKLIKYCLKNSKIDTHVILCPFISLDVKLTKKYILDNKKILLKEKINFKYYKNYFLELEKLHVIFIQQPYEQCLPHQYSIRKIRKLGIRICYIQYGGEFHFNFLKLFSEAKIFLLNTWCIFSRSEKNKKIYKKFLNNKLTNIIVTGNPKYDHFFEKKKLSNIIVDKIKKKKVLFWATSFYQQEPIFDKDCSFWHYHESIFEFVKKNKDIFLIFKPHPLLWSSLVKYNIVNNNFRKDIVKDIRKIDNVFYDDNINYINFFKITDYLISDNNSILLSFYITSKPIIFLNNPSISFSKIFYALKKSLYVANNINELKFFINNLNNNLDPLMNLRKKINNQNFNYLDGKSSFRIVSNIISELSVK